MARVGRPTTVPVHSPFKGQLTGTPTYNSEKRRMMIYNAETGLEVRPPDADEIQEWLSWEIELCEEFDGADLADDLPETCYMSDGE